MAVSPLSAIAAYQPVLHVQPVKRAEKREDATQVKNNESSPPPEPPQRHQKGQRVDIRV